jgi:hypothetical protein
VWHQKNKHGERRTLMLAPPYDHDHKVWDSLKNGHLKVFRTRRLAAEAREYYYGYIRERSDLKNEPHGWFLPYIVPIKIEATELDRKRVIPRPKRK